MASVLDEENEQLIQVPLIGIDRNCKYRAKENELQMILQSAMSSNDQTHIKTACTKFPELLFDLEYIEKSLRLLEDQLKTDSKLKDDVITTHPWILLLNHDYLRLRFRQVHTVFEENNLRFDSFPVDCLGPLFVLKSTKSASKLFSLNKLAEWYETPLDENRFNDRLNYFHHHLLVSRLRVIELLHTHPYLFTQDLTKIKVISGILTKWAKVDPADIARDLQIYRMKLETAKSRLNVLKSVELHPIKCWMFRCPDDVIGSTLNLWKQRVDVFGSSQADAADYLRKTLQVTEKDINRMVETNPGLLSTRPIKLKQMTEYLLSIGASVQDIVCCPRIYQKSLQTVKSRVGMVATQQPKLLKYLGALGLHTKGFEKIMQPKKQNRRRPKFKNKWSNSDGFFNNNSNEIEPKEP